MEELFALRNHIEQHHYAEALDLIAEMEEMSREDKINKIRSFCIVLLLHLIKQEAEHRTTRSWDISIWNVTQEIAYVNQRRKIGGTYLSEEELREVIAEAYPVALRRASLEVSEGKYDVRELDQQVDRGMIEQKALALIITFKNE